MRLPVAALAMAVGFCSFAVAGPAGTLDPSFGVGGRVVSNQLFFTRIVQAPDGDIIAAGKSGVTNSGVLARYQSDGSLDPSFGTGGLIDDPTVFAAPDAGYPGFYDLAIQADGKFLVVMTDRVTFDDVVRRHHPSGALDATFDGDGILSVPFASRVAVQVDGNIIVASRAPVPPNNTDWDVRLSRFDSAGVPDSSFGSGGSVVTDVGYRPHSMRILLQPDGRILATGAFGNGTPASGAFLMRYLSGGSLDPSFGTGGKVLESSPSTVGSSLALQPDGKILTSGAQLARRDHSGMLDPTFGVGGIGSTLLAPQAVQPDGRILGLAQAGDVILLRRLMPDGTVDIGFGDAGDGETSAGLHGVATLLRQADGRIVTAFLREHYFTLERHLGGTCGDTVVEGGEECDDANAISGDGCEPSCCLTDGDGDGRCDAYDPCTSPAAQDAQAVFSGVGTNRRRFKVKGVIDLPMPAVALDPAANGVRIVLREAEDFLYDFTVPGGALGSPPGYGWTASGSPARAWKFRGSFGSVPSSGVPDFANVNSLKITRTTNMPNRVKFSLKTTLVRDEPGSSLTVTLVLDPPSAASGQCGELMLPCVATASSVRCKL